MPSTVGIDRLGLLPKKLDVAAEFDTRFNSIAQEAK